jgi:uncharacterized protein (TIGR02117 family)
LKTIKKTGIIILKSTIGLLLAIVAYFLIAIITTIIPVNSNYKMSDSGTEIWVSSNGVHTNIIVPANSKIISWKDFLKIDKNSEYVVFGWGEKEFYMNTPTWADLKLGTAIKAAFWFNESVLQVYGLSSKPSESENTIKIILNTKQANKLNTYIYDTFALNSDGSPSEQIPEKGPGSLYKYYKAKGKYSMFFTCNNWTNRGLKESGVKNALWAPFDKSVLYQLK